LLHISQKRLSLRQKCKEDLIYFLVAEFVYQKFKCDFVSNFYSLAWKSKVLQGIEMTLQIDRSIYFSKSTHFFCVFAFFVVSLHDFIKLGKKGRKIEYNNT